MMSCERGVLDVFINYFGEKIRFVKVQNQLFNLLADNRMSNLKISMRWIVTKY